MAQATLRKIKQIRAVKAVVFTGAVLIMSMLFLYLYDLKGTGVPVHEILGTCIIAVVALHLIKNRFFFSSVCRNSRTANGKCRYDSLYFVYSDVINTAVTLGFFFCLITGILGSKVLFKDILEPVLPFSRSTAEYLHRVTVYPFMVILGLHIGLHLKTFFSFISENLGRVTGRLIEYAVYAGALLGAYFFFSEQIFTKFNFVRSRALNFSQPDLPHFLYLCELSCVIALFAVISSLTASYLLNKCMLQQKES